MPDASTLAGVYPAVPPDLDAMRPTLARMARDAIDYHHGGLCGYAGHLAWVEQYERPLDILEPRPALIAAPET